MKYKKDDPVWIIRDRMDQPCRIAGTILGIHKVNKNTYFVDIEGHPPPKVDAWNVHECWMIPRKEEGKGYDGDEKVKDFDLIQAMTGGWNPRKGISSRPTIKEKEKL